MHRNLITTPIFLHNPNVSQRPFSSTILGVIDQNSGTYFDYWDSPVVIRLAEELQKVLPEVLAGHELSHAWMYLYDSEVHDEVLVAERQPNGTFLAGEHGAGSGGIPEHADQAAVNVNIWLTPDRFNGDLGGGGLEVFDRYPPPEWNFLDMNQHTDRITSLLRGRGEKGDPDYVPPSSSVKTPYRQNRMGKAANSICDCTLDPVNYNIAFVLCMANAATASNSYF